MIQVLMNYYPGVNHGQKPLLTGRINHTRVENKILALVIVVSLWDCSGYCKSTKARNFKV
jgi:hypothetical protein